MNCVSCNVRRDGISRDGGADCWKVSDDSRKKFVPNIVSCFQLEEYKFCRIDLLPTFIVSENEK